jgi:hypothetical protein
MELRTEISIQASPETVWAILMDFASYPQWNPFIQSLSGEAKVGSQLVARMLPHGGKTMTFKPSVKVVNIHREFRWKGKLFIPGLFDGEHIFELFADGAGGTRFVQRENFSGILVPLMKKMLEGGTRQGFEAMNRALKARAEKK